jgi:mercuric ion transport protein
MRQPGCNTKRKTNMKDEKLLRGGLIGSLFAAICCFTPFLVVIVAGVGLSAIVGWLDYALFPLLFASLGVVAHALWIRAGRPGPCPRNLIIALVIALSALLFWLEFRYAVRLSAAAAIAVALYDYWLGRIAKSDRAAAKPE